MAEPNIFQVDDDVDQSLYLSHLLRLVQEGELPFDSSNAHGNIWHDLHHNRLLRTSFLR